MAYVPSLQEIINGTSSGDDGLQTLEQLIASAPPKKPDPTTNNLGGHVAAGVLDMFNLPAYGALLGHGLDAVVPDNPVTGAIQSALDSSAGSYSDWVNETTGTTDPDTIPESAARLLSALTPAGILRKGAMKVLPAAVTANRGAQVAGNVLDYTVLPGVVGKYTKTNAALNFGIPFGIEQGINEYYAEPKTGNEMSTIFDFLPGANEQNMPIPTNVTSTIQVDMPYAMPPELFAKIREQEIMDDKNDTDWQLKALGGLAVLGGIQAFRSYTHGAKLRRETVKAGDNPVAQPTPTEPQTPRTVVERAANTTSATTPQEAFVTQNQDSMFALQSQLERGTGDADYAQDVAARIRQQVGSNSTASIKHSMDTGELNYTFGEFSNGQFVERTGTLTMPKFTEWKMQYDVLNDAEREVYGKGRFAADAWDNRQTARQITGNPNAAPSATNWSDTELRGYMQDLESNPKLKALADAEKQMYDTLLKFQLESGRISSAQFRQLRGERPNYMYNMVAQELDAADEAFDYSPQKLYQRSTETGMGAQEVLNPAVALETYFNQTVRAAKTNALQREVIDGLFTSTDRTIRESLAKVRKPDKPNTVLDPATHVRIFRNGVEEVYEFADPLMVSSLRLAPYAAKHTWWNMQRKIAQQLNTGLLQPMFAPVAASMDAFITTVARSPDREFGILDRLSRSLTGDRVGVKGDPTALLLAAYGAGRGVAHRFAEGLSDNIYKILAADAPITRVLDPQAMKAVADRMRNYYLLSDTAILREAGVFNSSYLADARFGFKKMANENTGALGTTYRAYVGMIDSIHQGSKLSFFSQNYYRLAKRHGGFDKIPKRELRKLLDESASSSGNLSLTGLGSRSKPVTQKPITKGDKVKDAAGTNQTFAAVNEWMSNALPYFNVQKQSLTHIGKAFYQNPAHVTAGVVTAIGLPVMMMHLMMQGQGQEYSDYYWNKIPAWKRSMHMYFPIPGKPPEEGMLVPVPHELSLMKALIEGGLDQAFGFANGRIASDEMADIKAALNNYFSVFVPPALSGGAALMGKQVSAGIGFGGSPVDVRDIQTETLSGDSQGRNVSSVLSANTEAFIQGLFGVTGAQFIEALNAGFAEEKGFDLVDFGEEYVSQQKQKAATRFGGWLYPGKEYTGTVASTELYEKKQLIERFNNVWNRMRGAGYVGGLRDPIELQGAMPPEVTNEKFKAAAPIIYEATMKKGVYKDLAKQRNQADKQIQSLRGVYPKTEAVIKQLNGWILQKNDITEKMVTELQTLEKQLGVKLEDLDPYAE